MVTCASSDSAAGKDAIRVERITVQRDRVLFEVEVALGVRTTTPEIAQRACLVRPGLPRHACVNGKGETFSAVMEHTPLPHLVEHLAIDVLTPLQSHPAAVVVGTSEWTDRQAGRALIALSSTDDVMTMGAFKEAVRIVNEEIFGLRQARGIESKEVSK